MSDRTDWGDFTSYAMDRRTQRERLRQYRETKRLNSQKTGGRGKSMTVKICVCIAICLMVIAANAVGMPVFKSALNNKDNNKDDTLGQLRFVELPGLLEVFAGGDKFIAPFDYSSACVSEDYTLMRLEGKANAMVTACGEGTVKATGTDEKLGKYVAIRHDGDTETYYYGLSAVTVDANQHINKLDTLGLADDSGVIFVQIRVEGKPVDPRDYLNIKAPVGVV